MQQTKFFFPLIFLFGEEAIPKRAGYTGSWPSTGAIHANTTITAVYTKDSGVVIPTQPTDPVEIMSGGEEVKLMNILSRGEAADIRQLFIDTFVDTTCNYFQNYILQMKSFSDGLRYTGYLWDCMIRRERVSYYFMQSTLEMHSGNFYVFWDIHSRDRILIKNYWKYPIDAVLCLAPKELPDVLQTLPEDCYFFDDSLSWAFASTHEELKPGKRICYMTTNT